MSPPRNFVSLWREVEPGLLALARFLVHDSDTARDIVQETALEVLARLDRDPRFWEQVQHPKRWLQAVVRHHAMDFWRANARKVRQNQDTIESIESWIQRKGAVDPSESVQTTEELEKLRTIVAALPVRQREIMERFLAGESTDSISRAMDIHENSVRSLLRFARGAVAKRFTTIQEVTHGDGS